MNAENDKRVDRLEEENLRLKEAVAELSILNDISTAISSTSSLDMIIDLIVHKCIKHLKVEQGTIALLDEKQEDAPFHTIIRKVDTSKEIIPFRLNAQLTGWMIKNQRALLINDLRNDERFSENNVDDYPVNSLICVPLLAKGKMIGSLNVYNKRDKEGFSENDKRLLTIIAAQSAQTIENARLYEEEQALLHMREEMRIAQRIQMELLPSESPLIDGYDVAGISIPAKTVGGDYFDFICLDDKRMAFCLGDISGKGMPAALLMSNLQATLRGQSLESLTACECVTMANSQMFKSTEDDKFATLFFAILDHKNHEIKYCNAGHNYPYLVSTNDHTRLEAGGLVLGAIEEYDFIEESVPIGQDDILLVFSDGASEAQDADGEFFTEQKLLELVMDHREESAERILDGIVTAVRAHSTNVTQTDDITLLVIKRL